MADFGDEEYKQMLCVEAAAIEKPVTLKPGEEWKVRLELSAVPSSYFSGQLDPKKVLQGAQLINIYAHEISCTGMYLNPTTTCHHAIHLCCQRQLCQAHLVIGGFCIYNLQ